MWQQLTTVLVVLCNRFMVAKSVQCRTKFELQKVCPVTYGTVLNQISNIPSPAFCSELCSSDTSCRSFTYDSKTSRCQTNSKTTTSFPTGCTDKFYYGLLVKGTCQDTWLFGTCSSNSDCTVPNSACINNVCTCANGYSYLYRLDSCLTHCSEYGSTFKEETYYLLDNNMADNYVNSLQQCLNNCINHNPLCRSFEYEISTKRCYLSQETGLTKPAAYVAENNDDWIEFLRNCA